MNENASLLRKHNVNTRPPKYDNIYYAFKARKTLPLCTWSKRTADDQRHACQDPFLRMKTMIAGPEIKRVTLMFKVISFTSMLKRNTTTTTTTTTTTSTKTILEKYLGVKPTRMRRVLTDFRSFKELNKSTKKRKAPDGDKFLWRYRLRPYLVDTYMRKLTLLEKIEFQGLSFLNFPPTLSQSQITKMVGNAMPSMVASCLFNAIDRIKTQLNQKKPWVNKTAISLFAGIGGMAMGFNYEQNQRDVEKDMRKNHLPLKPLGFKHLLLVEYDPLCIEVLSFRKANQPHYDWDYDVVVRNKVENIDYTKYRGKVGILSGGPPCQPFSGAGYRGGLEDFRSGWESSARALLDTEAEVFVFENVSTLITHRTFNPSTLNPILKMLSDPWFYFEESQRLTATGGGGGEEEEGSSGMVVTQPSKYIWKVSCDVVNCADYGIPQERNRSIFIGFRIERKEATTTTTTTTRMPLDYKNQQNYEDDNQSKHLESLTSNPFLTLTCFKREDTRCAWDVVKDVADKNGIYNWQRSPKDILHNVL